MKIIMAGYSKTGTKSMNAALTELGFKVYDNMEHFMFHFEDWLKILKGNGTIADFKRMYANVDAAVDHPVFIFWHEIHQAFPDAKIILTIRDEDSWYKSLSKQCDEGFKDSVRAFSAVTIYILPLLRKAFAMLNAFALDVTGRPMMPHGRSQAYRVLPDPMISKQRYRKHNAFVMQEAPKDKLLVFDVKQGWEPLCKFLDKEIPDKPFPWKNIGGKGYVPENYMRWFEKQARKELMIFFLVVLLLLLTLYFYIYEYDWRQTFSTSLFGTLLWYYFL